MKTILVAFALVVSSLGIYAQEPMGGGLGGDRPPMGGFNQMEDEEDLETVVVKFPEIPRLTVKQRAKVIAVVVKEHDAVAKLETEKRALFSKQGFPSQKRLQPQGAPGRPEDSLKGQRLDRAGNDQPQVGGQHPGPGQPGRPALSAKDEKKLQKIDAQLVKVQKNSDKKYRSILSEEQYCVFAEKKKQIQFNSGQDGNDRKVSKGNRQQRPNGNGGGVPPDMPMGGGGGEF